MGTRNNNEDGAWVRDPETTIYDWSRVLGTEVLHRNIRPSDDDGSLYVFTTHPGSIDSRGRLLKLEKKAPNEIFEEAQLRELMAHLNYIHKGTGEPMEVWIVEIDDEKDKVLSMEFLGGNKINATNETLRKYLNMWIRPSYPPRSFYGYKE